MKSTPLLIAASLLIAVATSASQETEPVSGKDLCLLDTAKCPGQRHYDLVEKIAHCRAALETGAKVYSPEELEHVKHLLEEALDIADMINADPSQVPENRFK
jgi:hypothetical protein